ncbi:hypothetical protein ACEXQD_18135 [Herbiconiux sp. P15]|uniref:hypothetical protein n=1 Tax=Herbiconiux liukaitaii TaxID=3342799 RepID=UPI0035B6E4A3
MSTDDRPDDKPEFPKGDPAAENRDGAAGATPPLPEIPAWEAPAAPASAEPAADARAEQPRPAAAPIPIPEPIQMPSEVSPAPETSADSTPGEDSATRAPLGGPYVVSETGAPIAEQAATAYDRQPSGGPYVTSSEPPVDAEPREARTPYPAAAFAPAPAPAGAAAGAAGASPQEAPTGHTAPIDPQSGYPTGYAPYQAAPQPLPPRPPRPRGNRGVGSLLALAGAVVFAAVYAGAAFLIIAANLAGDAAVTAFSDFLLSAAFIVPVAAFALTMILLVLILNRARWWTFVLGGFLVGIVVYFAGIAGALVHVQAWNWQAQQQYEFVRSLTMDPLTLAGAIIAREAAIWTGAVIALRGRRLKARNAAEREEFERGQAETRTASAEGQPAVTTTW